MKLLIILVFFFTIILSANDKKTINDLSFAYGDSADDINIYRVSLKKDLNKYFFKKRYKYLPTYYESSLSYWNMKRNSHLYNLSFTPMFRYTFAKQYDYNPFIEAGIGLSYLSKNRLGTENFGTLFQFEDVIGIGLKIQDFTVSYRFIHYSNAGITEHNSGANVNFISISYRF